ncbi:thiolase family protein [Lysinibacillus sphaericus]|uniref:Acetyl-CoA acetyltransferase n=2 Tax=Lysinibacillus TaxID=400634 RepID=A0A2S0K2J0_LYSSH|nr:MULTISPECIES: thiolase family protein [Lysinibacillus]AVK97590.1 acetyl-CoA acetyltransferase [Lysinibacillus sphaericus]MED4545543.1 thiolase family protein [Lysinibacillus sphaericus]TKI17791.1 thiolase family protein [Lysinibacillus sphaericus]TKI47966.1 thiolase family protein [Lysinibacillus tabacifolii]UDK96260.1 thiolase family protein [Lysinibacillus sphaericus]
MREVVIVAAVRTAVGRSKGALKDVRADDLAADVLQEVVKRAGIDKGQVEDVIFGCVTQSGEQGANIARTALLMAGFPEKVPGVTIDRQCGSSQQAVHFGAQAILAGDMDTVIAGGVESMTRVPMFSNMQSAHKGKRLQENYTIIHQGLSAEKMAAKWQFSKDHLNHFAYESHRRALAAIEAGLFQQEIMPVHLTQEDGTVTIFNVDEGPRADTTMERLNNLKTVFQEQGVITAGNASQMSDGASAVVLMSLEKAQELGIQPLAKIVTRVVVGSDPTLMLTGPIEATRQALKRAGLTIEEIDTYEVNEAFAPVPLAWLHDIGADPAKLNPDGGAIALGHPLGATGTKLLTTMVYRMQRENLRYGLIAICEGMGMANATIIEKM